MTCFIEIILKNAKIFRHAAAKSAVSSKHSWIPQNYARGMTSPQSILMYFKCVFITFILSLMTNYYIFLDTPLKNYFSAKDNLEKITQIFIHAKQQQQKDIFTQKALKNLNMHPALYALATHTDLSNYVTNDALSLSRNAGLSIEHIDTSKTDHAFQLSVTANASYFALLTLLEALQQHDCPLYISTLTIEKQHDIHLEFSTGNIA